MDTSPPSEERKPGRRFRFLSLLTPRSIRVRSPSRAEPTSTEENTPEENSESSPVTTQGAEDSKEKSTLSSQLHHLQQKTTEVSSALQALASSNKSEIEELSLTVSEMQHRGHTRRQSQPVVGNWMSTDETAHVSVVNNTPDPLAPLVFRAQTDERIHSSPVTSLLPGQSPLVDIMAPISYHTHTAPPTRSLPTRSASVPNSEHNLDNVMSLIPRHIESNSAPRMVSTAVRAEPTEASKQPIGTPENTPSQVGSTGVLGILSPINYNR